MFIYSWNRVISTTPAIMKKFVLKIGRKVFPYYGNCHGQFWELMTLERHFASANISDLGSINSSQGRLVRLMERFGKKFTSVCIENSELIFQSHSEILTQMPQLMKLTLIDLNSYRRIEGDHEPVTLKKLKKLEVQSNWDFFRLIRVPGLLNLTVRTENTDRDSTNFEYFLNASPQIHTFVASLSSRVLLKILKQMPQLENLTLIDLFSSNHRTQGFFAPVVLKKLKTLEVRSGGWELFVLIRAPALVNLTVRTRENNPDPISFESFLETSPKLESLEMHTRNTDFLGTYIYDFPFQLINLICYSHCGGELSDNTKQFLLLQAATVRTLKVNHFDSEFYKIVLSHFNRLETLDFEFHTLEASEYFCKNLKPFPLMTKISVFDGFLSESLMRATLGNCSKLKSLKCLYDEDLPKYLDFIAEHNKNLEILKIRAIRATKARFSHLHCLSVLRVENAADLIAFIQTNPTIKSLHIQIFYESDLSEASLSVLINRTSLRSLWISGIDRISLSDN